LHSNRVRADALRSVSRALSPLYAMLHLLTLAATASVVTIARAQGTVVDATVLDACPGYTASHVTSKGASLSADLTLAGTACNVFGEDVKTLKLQVDYETGS
jgi:alpha-glucosidase